VVLGDNRIVDIHILLLLLLDGVRIDVLSNLGLTVLWLVLFDGSRRSWLLTLLLLWGSGVGVWVGAEGIKETREGRR